MKHFLERFKPLSKRPEPTVSDTSPSYKVLLHKQSRANIDQYLRQLIDGRSTPGLYLSQQIKKSGINELKAINGNTLLHLLLKTKFPQIFAEMAVYGDGSDWTREELKLLGDIGIACKVTIYDDGRHQNPNVHETASEGYLLFTPGALLRNGRDRTPVDWDVVDQNCEIDLEKYYELYERRLLPLFIYANTESKQLGKKAIITIPGIGCGQFAGQFSEQLGEKLEKVLERLLTTYRAQLDALALVYFDPYQECIPKTYDIEGLSFVVNPQIKAIKKLNQLCPPHTYLNNHTSNTDLMLFSFVAWDHVSWPGNDFYQGIRATDDGVKAAATNCMEIITGIKGSYDLTENCYLPPKPFNTWFELIVKYQKNLI